MDNQGKKITIEATIHAPVEKVWELWTLPKHITQWSFASEDWHTPKATNDLREGGKFSSTMAAKDGSVSFDFGGTYDSVVTNESIAYTLDDNRTVQIIFNSTGDETKVTQTFEAENTHAVDFQQAGWQSILNNFKKYVEAN